MPWSLRPVHLTIDNEVQSVGEFHHLECAKVRSVALGNVRFRLPLVVPRDPARPPDEAEDLIVNELFESLFSDIDNPIEGFAAAITAIPLAIVAPLIAFGEALGSLFGGSSEKEDAPELPVVDLAGPIDLHTTTLVWTADGRVLDADTQATLALSGRLPELPGQASGLSGKVVRLDVDLRISRTHAAPFPEPRDPPGRGWIPLIAALLNAIAIAMVVSSALRRRRGA